MKANEFYMKKNVVCIAGVLAVSACTSVQVNAVSENQVNAIHQICSVNNPKVLVKDFVPVVQSRVQHHGIVSRVVEGSEASACTYQLQYSAKRSWDFTPYMSWAELKLYQNEVLIANAEYKLVGKGGLSLTKWQSVETKMTPVIDQLFAKRNNQKASRSVGSVEFETEVRPVNSH